MPFPILHPKIDIVGPSWNWANNVFVAPAPGTVFLDTGALVAGSYEVYVSAVSSANSDTVIEHYNGGGVLHSLGFTAAIGSMPIIIPRFDVALNDGIRMVTITGGSTQSVAMLWRRVG